MPTRTFASRADAVPAARGFVVDALAAAPPQLCQTAALLASELVTNAVRHSGAREFTVRVDYQPADGRVRVEVGDTGHGHPQLQQPSVTAEHGRGLRLVSLLADRWGAHRRRATMEKTVWFELLAAAGPDTADEDTADAPQRGDAGPHTDM